MDAVLNAAIAAKSSLSDAELASQLDHAGASICRRDKFLFPRTEDTAVIRKPGSASVYLCGNSLGLQPSTTRAYIEEELHKWSEYGVEGHFRTERPWVTVDETVRDASAALVGALPSEVVVMNSLTVNLHLLMVSFYRPTAIRYKILLEEHAFPSDTYAVQSQVQHHASTHGHSLEEALVFVRPREGEETLRTEDILSAIRTHGDSLALVMLPGVQYYTGQLLDIPTITAAGKATGAAVGWDLAHAAGNVPLKLHEWGVDFAAWCSYKYLNSGPGGIAGAFVHECHGRTGEEEAGAGGAAASASPAGEPVPLPRFAGWWGHRKSDRFKMGSDFHPSPGAAGWQLSNPPVFQTAALRSSLDVFMSAGSSEAGGKDFMARLRERSLVLTRYLELLLQAELPGEVIILTPSDPLARGAQLSLSFTLPVRSIQARLGHEGVIVDVREPHVMRVAPAPLYNTASDVREFVVTLKAVVAEIRAKTGPA